MLTGSHSSQRRYIPTTLRATQPTVVPWPKSLPRSLTTVLEYQSRSHKRALRGIGPVLVKQFRKCSRVESIREFTSRILMRLAPDWADRSRSSCRTTLCDDRKENSAQTRVRGLSSEFSVQPSRLHREFLNTWPIDRFVLNYASPT